MRRLVRDNAADPRVQHDLGVLADAYGRDGEGVAGEGVRLSRDLDVLSEAYGPGGALGWGSWRDDVVEQLRRHRALCAVTILLLLMLVLVDPVEQGAEPAAASLPSVETGPAEETAPSPTTGPEPPPAGEPSFEEPVAPPTAVTEEETSFVPPPPPPPLEGLPAAPSPLRIVESGYASATGGTPAEREPPDGALPVAGAAGNASRLSFVRLAGTATSLRLREAADTGNVNAASAVVRACKITDESWRGTRGVPLSEAPPFDEDECVAGKRNDEGTWTFDFQRRRDRTDRTGFALVPGDGPGDTFQLAFSPEAVA